MINHKTRQNHKIWYEMKKIAQIVQKQLSPTDRAVSYIVNPKITQTSLYQVSSPSLSLLRASVSLIHGDPNGSLAQPQSNFSKICPNSSSQMPSSQILPISAHQPDLLRIGFGAKPGALFHGDADDPTARLLLSPTEKLVSVKPIIPRAFSYSGVAGNNRRQQRRRRAGSESSLSSLEVDDGGGGGVAHAAAETFLIARLGLKLLSCIGVGYRWIARFAALAFYSFLLMPGFIQVGYYYFFSRQVRRSIVYGDQPRNRLDLYLPKNRDGPKPVVAFITGGAWIIGYKAWGSLLGQQLSERDILVACIDYRNFPQGTISDMIEDTSQGISFVCNNIADYGGDPNRIYLMGQSAGAHIAACTLVEQAIKEAGGKSVSWSVSKIKFYFGLSGGYNLFKLTDHFHSRGLYRSIFLSIMEGEESLQRFSPEVMVQDPNVRNAFSRLPPITLFHGTGDYSIPSDASKSFADTLRRVGVTADSILYEGKTHTDLFLQDPMRGGRDTMLEDLLTIIHKDDLEAQTTGAVAPPRRRLVPEFMLKLATRVSPF